MLFRSWPADAAASLVAALGPARLASVLRRLVGDYDAFRTGMPDMVAWSTGTVVFIEAKHLDAVSPQQRHWMAWLRRQSIPAWVVRLRLPRR